MNKRICIVGLGHVGLTLAVTMAEKGFNVYGVEKNQKALEAIKSVSPPFFEEDLEDVLKKNLGKSFHVSDKLPEDGANTYIIAVGTPFDFSTGKPKLDDVIIASNEIAAEFPEGALLLLRSTVPIGTCRNILIPTFKKTGKKFYFAMIPERTCEGVALKELLTLPQVIGGMDEESFEKTKNIFEKFVSIIVKASPFDIAETIKLVDNCWRDTTFAFANEIALLSETLGFDATDVINLANLGYERNTIPKPGFVGGPCLTKDPYLLIQSAIDKNIHLSLVEAGRNRNLHVTERVWERLQSFLVQTGKDINDCKIFLSGLAFKGHPPTDDVRGSSSLDLIEFMRGAGIKSIYGHDFVVRESEVDKVGVKAVSLEEGFNDADAVLIMNNHKSYEELDLEKLISRMNKPSFFFDAWHIFPKKALQNIEGLTYGGIGF